VVICDFENFERGIRLLRGVLTMSPKTDTEVLIGGKVFTLSGYESEDYMQKIYIRLYRVASKK